MNQEQLQQKPLYNVFQVANCFIKLFKDNNKPLTHMQLQKLVYYSYGFYLYWYSVSLFENKFQPWAFGPVDPDLYSQIKKVNWSAYNIINIIDNVDLEGICDRDTTLKEITTKVYNAFIDWDATSLSNLSHRSTGAWYKAKQNESGELNNNDILTEIKFIDDSSTSNK